MVETLPADGKIPPRRSRWRRWLIRLGALAVLGMMIITIAAALLWQRRTQIVNHFLADALAPWWVKAGSVDVDFSGRTVELADVRIADTRDGPAWASASRLWITAPLAALGKKRIETIDLEHLDVQLSDSFIEKIKNWPQKPAQETRSSSWREVGRVRIGDARVTANIAGLPRLEARFDYDGRDVRLGTGLPQLGRQSLALRHLEATSTDGGALAIDAATLTFSFDAGPKRLVVEEVAIPRLNVVVTPQLLAGTSGLMRPNENNSPSAPAPSMAPAPMIGEIAIDRLALASIDFRLAGFARAPEIALRGSWHGSSIRSSPHGGGLFAGTQNFVFNGIEVLDPNHRDRPVIAAPALEASASAAGEEGIQIERFELPGATLAVQPAVLDWLGLSSASPAPEPAPSSLPAVAAPMPRLRIGSAVIDKLSVSIAGLANGEALAFGLPDARAQADIVLKNLTLFQNARMTSPDPQRLVVRDAEVAFDSPFARVATAELELVPDDFFARREVRTLRLARPDVELSPAVASRFSKPAGTTRQPSASVAAPDPNSFSLHGVRARDLSITDGQLKLKDFGNGFPNIETGMAIRSDGDPAIYHVTLQDLTAASPNVDPGTFARVGSVVGEIHSERIWNSVIDSLIINGAEIEIGKAMSLLVQPDPEPTVGSAPVAAPRSEPAAVRGPSGDPWRIEKAAIVNSQLTVADVVPLLDPVTVGVTVSISRLPLTRDGLLTQTDPQRIELARLRINSAYGGTGSLPVATLDTVFVEFSLAGLLEKKIDRVGIVSPVIYVGEQLFWYVDYFRKTTGNPDDSLASASTSPSSAAAAAENQVWSVGRVDAYFGKLRLALKGSVIDSLPPLPFSCSTELDRGRVDLTLEIPRGTYRPSTHWPLEVDVEEGTAAFNLPIRQKDNNLVQVFRASELRYGKGKPFLAHNVYTSVTYDKNGVYGKFGGELYNGYVNGGFDIYLDDNLSWDCWLAGERIAMKPLTDVMTPEYLQMKGPAHFKLEAYGDIESLYTSNGSFWTSKPGELTITGLDALREKMPGIWAPLEGSLAIRGVETMRDFPFESCRGDFKLYGREGNLNLHLAGPRGLRALELRVHDHTAHAPSSDTASNNP